MAMNLNPKNVSFSFNPQKLVPTKIKATTVVYQATFTSLTKNLVALGIGLVSVLEDWWWEWKTTELRVD